MALPSKLFISVVITLLACGVAFAGDEDGEGENGDDAAKEADPNPKKVPNSVGLGGKDRTEEEKRRYALFDERSTRFGDSDNKERIRAALNWLRDHQAQDGHWSAYNFPADTSRGKATRTGNLEFVKPGETDSDVGWDEITDVGVTGLAMLAFSACGFHYKDGEFRDTLRQAVLYLRRLQAADGCFGSKDEDLFVYNHAIATTAICEVVALTQDAIVKLIAQPAVDFILKAQNPGAGWRYGVRPGENDSSTTGWMVTALATAERAGLEVDTDAAYKGAFGWFDKVTVAVDGRMKTGYDVPGSVNTRLRSAADYDSVPAMEALHGFVRLYTGRAEGHIETLDDFVSHVYDSLPMWEEQKVDFYYWFWASAFLQQYTTKDWPNWRDLVNNVLLKHQRGWHETDVKNKQTTAKALDEHGSWDPVGAWGAAGGRVYSTALGAMILATEIKYPAPPTEKPPEEPEDAGNDE